MTAPIIILGTLSGIGMCYHLIRTAHRRTRLDVLLVVGYAALVLGIARVLSAPTEIGYTEFPKGDKGTYFADSARVPRGESVTVAAATIRVNNISRATAIASEFEVDAWEKVDELNQWTGSYHIYIALFAARHVSGEGRISVTTDNSFSHLAVWTFAHPGDPVNAVMDRARTGETAAVDISGDALSMILTDRTWQDVEGGANVIGDKRIGNGPYFRWQVQYGPSASWSNLDEAHVFAAWNYAGPAPRTPNFTPRTIIY